MPESATMPTEDEFYEQWRGCDDEKRKRDIETQLFPLVLNHAKAVIWEKLQESNESIAMRIAEDAIQGCRRFKGESMFSTWVHAIAMNHCALEIRTRKSYRKHVNERAAIDFDNCAAPASDANIPISLDQLGKGLTAKEQQVFNGMREGRDQNELAEQLGIHPRAAESQRRRLQRKLQKKVRPT